MISVFYKISVFIRKLKACLFNVSIVNLIYKSENSSHVYLYINLQFGNQNCDIVN